MGEPTGPKLKNGRRKGESSLGDNWDPARNGVRRADHVTRQGLDICGAKLKGKEGRCTKTAGWGTDHVGTGCCKFHGGKAPSHARANGVPQLELLVGHKVNIDPLQALLMCVRIAAAEVMYYSAQISMLQDNEVVEDAAWGKQLNIWIRSRDNSTDRLAKYSKMALDAGVAERQVNIAETLGRQLAGLLQGIMNELGLTSEQKIIAAEVIPRKLAVLNGGL